MSSFWRKKELRRFLYVLGLAVFMLYELVHAESVRRTFVFYQVRDEAPVVEDRLLRSLGSEELEIRGYVEETLLGPVTPETAPLFCREARLRSLMYRDGTVYVDLTEEAALPPLEDAPPKEGEIFRNLQTLEEGIRRNFPGVQEVKLFINGHQV